MVNSKRLRPGISLDATPAFRLGSFLSDPVAPEFPSVFLVFFSLSGLWRLGGHGRFCFSGLLIGPSVARWTLCFPSQPAGGARPVLQTCKSAPQGSGCSTFVSIKRISSFRGNCRTVKDSDACDVVSRTGHLLRGLRLSSHLDRCASVFVVRLCYFLRPCTMISNTGVRSIRFFNMSMMSSWSLAPSINSSRVNSPEGSKRQHEAQTLCLGSVGH